MNMVYNQLCFSICLLPICPGIDSRPGVTSGSSFLLVLFLPPRWFSLGTPVFPSLEKANITEFKFDPVSEGHMFVSRKNVKCCYPR